MSEEQRASSDAIERMEKDPKLMAELRRRLAALRARIITAGTKVVVTDAEGVEHEVEALSGIEREGHTFPVVWVARPLVDGGTDRVPWPVEAVRIVSTEEDSRRMAEAVFADPELRAHFEQMAQRTAEQEPIRDDFAWLRAGIADTETPAR